MTLTNKLIAKLLVLCGVSLTCTACYGIPEPPGYMTNIEGMVKDEATGQPIEGIKIRSNSVYAEGGVGTSDADGKFNFEHYASPPSTIVLTVEDIDGPENGGEYATETRETEIVQKNFAPGDDGWNGVDTQWEAGWKVDFALRLKPQEEDENE